MKIPLCEKCHNILHLQIGAIIFSFVNNKESCIKEVKNFTLKKTKNDILPCPKGQGI